MRLLMQVNAPGDPDWDYRAIYIFCCTQTDCLHEDPSGACVVPDPLASL